MCTSTEPTLIHARSHLKSDIGHLDGRGGGSRYIMGSGNAMEVSSAGTWNGVVMAAPKKGAVSQKGPNGARAAHGPHLWSCSDKAGH